MRNDLHRYTRWGEGGTGLIELYDRQKDPDEMINLADEPEMQKVVMKMDQLLNERIRQASIAPAGLIVDMDP